TVRHGLNQGMKRKGGLGWLPEFLTGSAVTREQEFLRSLDLTDLVVYDIGSFQGLLALFFARQARQVICSEPNSLNHARLLKNLELNLAQNVVVRKIGIGARRESAAMVADSLMPGGATIDASTAAGIHGSRWPVLTEQIQVTSLDDDIREVGLPAPAFIKIDI